MSGIFDNLAYSTLVLLGKTHSGQGHGLFFDDRFPVPHLGSGRVRTRFLVGNLRETAIAWAKKIVPGSLIREVRRYRRFKKSERPTYLRLRIMNQLGLRPRRVPPGARSFVFVCFGNIMRSPMSEAFFKEAIARYPGIGVKIVSAGLNATPGTPAHPWAIAAAQEFGISLAGHRAALLTRAIVDEADAILAMDFQNQVDLLSRYPDAAGRCFLLGAYSGTARPIEIQDPFYGDLGETRRCYRLLQTCTQNLAESLDAIRPQDTAPSSRAR
jgi:protein-tyrosine phosphatase